MGQLWSDFVNNLFGFQVNVMSVVIITAFAALMTAIFVRRSTLHCTDLITSPDGRLSRTAIGQTFGIIVAVWAPVITTLQGKLDSTVLMVCLAYLALVEGYSKYLRWKSDQPK